MNVLLITLFQGWTEESNGDFSPIGECLINQYDQFDVKEIKDQEFRLNGKLTLDENFPDNGGLLEAYQAYKLAASKNQKNDKKLPGLDKFSPEQLYFLGFATVSKKYKLYVHPLYHIPFLILSSGFSCNTIQSVKLESTIPAIASLTSAFRMELSCFVLFFSRIGVPQVQRKAFGNRF